MQFGLFTIVPWHESLHHSPRPCMMPWSRSNLADRLGLDEVWLGNIAFHGTACCGFFSFAGTVVARTQKVRIGTAGGVAAAQSYPGGRRGRHVGCAERWRMEIGGQWLPGQEFDGLGIDMNESRARSARPRR